MKIAPYAGGFIAGTNQSIRSAQPNPTWQLKERDGFFWSADPDLEVNYYAGTARCVMVIGPNFNMSYKNDFFKLLTDCEIEDYFRMLDDLTGRFCIIRFESGEVFAAKDAFGSRSVYYSLNHDGIFSSHAELLAKHLECARDAEMTDLQKSHFYKSLSVKYLPGSRTLYEGVRSLPTNTELNIASKTINRFWPAQPRLEHNNLEAVDQRMDLYFSRLREFLSRKTVFVGMTGGVDTRFLTAGLIAAHKERGDKLDLRGMTWLGGYSSDEEREVAARLANSVGIPVTLIPLGDVKDEVSKVSGRNSGNMRGPSRLSSGIHHALKDIGKSIFLIGYGGEIVRGFYNLTKNPISDCTAPSLAEAYIKKSRAKGIYEDGYDPVPVVTAAFEEFIEDTKIHRAVEHGYDINDIFYWEHRMGNWAAIMLDEIGSGPYCMAGINDRKLYEACLSLPSKVRLKKYFLKRRIDEWVPIWKDLPLV